MGSGPQLPFGLLPLTVSIATDDPGFPTVPAARLVTGTFCFPLAARFTGSADMAAVKSSEGTEGSLCPFREPGDCHLLGVIGFWLLGGTLSVILEKQLSV